jgi:glutaredoxin
MNAHSAKNTASRDITIYSVAACPYAQRTRILLAIKKIDAKLVELDLSKRRPDWFLAINPAGKVPCACRKSNTHIQMMESAKKWRRHNATNGVYCSRHRGVLVD